MILIFLLSGSSSGGGSGSSSGIKNQPVSGIQNNKNSVSSYGRGDSKVSTISSGIFAGRTVGGGTRDQVYGNRYVIFFHCLFLSLNIVSGNTAADILASLVTESVVEDSHSTSGLWHGEGAWVMAAMPTSTITRLVFLITGHLTSTDHLLVRPS